MAATTDPRALTSCGMEPLLAEQPCERCGLTDWYSFPELFDIRCGGCGLWYVTEMLKHLGVETEECHTDE